MKKEEEKNVKYERRRKAISLMKNPRFQEKIKSVQILHVLLKGKQNILNFLFSPFLRTKQEGKKKCK